MEIDLNETHTKSFNSRGLIQKNAKSKFFELIEKLLIDIDKLEKIKLIEIVLITDGADILTRCAFGLDKCSSEKPCPFHFKYKPIRESLQRSLSEISIYDMALKTEQGEAFLKI